MSKMKKFETSNEKVIESDNYKDSNLTVNFLNLEENKNDDGDDSLSDQPINLRSIKKINKKPIVLDFSLPKPNEQFLNLNKSKFKIKSVNSKPDYKILTGELNTLAYEGKIKPSDFNSSQ